MPPTPPPTTSSVPPPGSPASRTIGGYRIIAGLGTGGMARVYLAMATKQGGFTKLLVLKVLRAELDAERGADDSFLEMFVQEARLAARLNHPNVVQTYEVGDDDGSYYIAMEYLEGQPLSSVISRVGREKLPLEIHLRILCDALEGLQYAHELTDYDGTPLGIVHRDVSPQNVFVTYAGHAKILDFGIAKISGSARTSTGILKGKASYMAPEQVAGAPVQRSDVFAIGIMLWEAIARRRFLERGMDEVVALTRRIGGKDPKIRELVPDAPAELADICDKAMAVDPNDRYASAAEIRDALEGYLRKGEHVDARKVAALLEKHFADERSSIRAVIEAQVKRADHSGPIVDIQASGTTTPGSGSVDVSLDTDAFEQRPARGRSRAILAGVVVVAAVLGGLAAWRSGSSVVSARPVTVASGTPTPVTAEPPVAPGTAASGSTSAGHEESQKVTISVRATPSTATLLLDGQPVENPYRTEVAKDGSRHTLQTSARGFASDQTVVVYDRPQDVAVTLNRIVPGRPPVVGSPSSPAEGDMVPVPGKRPKRTVDDKDPYQ